jgi:hypothetical protein
MTEQLPPAGWYADPAGSGGRRFWDGGAWTGATAPDQPVAGPGPTPTPATAAPQAAQPTMPMNEAPQAPGAFHPPGQAPSYGGGLPGGTPAPANAWPAGSPGRAPAVRLSPRVWAGLGLAVAIVLAIVLRGGQTHDVAGTFELYDDRFLYQADGSSCSGSGGYGDIRAGIPVTVRDASGTLLASSSLRGGEVEGLRCVFTFELTDVDRSDFYTFEVGRRGELTYSNSELAANGWHVDLYLGDR